MIGNGAPAAGALTFACALNAVTIWFSHGAVGAWIAFLGLGLGLVTLALESAAKRDFLVSLFLALGALGLGFFSGSLVGASLCAALWPLLGVAAAGGRLGTGIGASAGTLIALVVLGTLIDLPSIGAIGSQSGILAIGVAGALALAASVRGSKSLVGLSASAQSQINQAQESRDQALAQAKEARAQTQGRAQFMAEMSHEIRTPLNAILGFADTMREGVFGPLPQAYGDYPDLIHTSGTHLLDLVSDLLDLSKIEAGRYETSLRPLRFDDLAYEGVRLSSGAARAGGVQLRHEAGPHIEVAADARALRQIVFNLVSNAIKFTPSGGRVTLRVKLDQEKDQASLEVEDTGVGIGEADLLKIGEPWNQSTAASHSDAKSSRGSGLGLALVKRLTELQGGQFAITSKLGEGTLARVTFPLAKQDPV